MNHESKEVVEVKNEVVYEDFEVDSGNIVIPKIMLMQGLSELVADGKAVMGDLVNNMTSEVIAKCDEAVEVIPLKFSQFMRIEKLEGKKYVWERNEAIKCKADESKPFEDVEAGIPIRRVKTREFVMLCPKISVLPFIVRFKSTSGKTGDSLYTMAFAAAKMSRKMPFERVFELKSVKTKNEKGTYAIWNFRAGRLPTAEELSQAQTWYNTLKVAKVEVEEKDEEPTAQGNYADDNNARF